MGRDLRPLLSGLLILMRNHCWSDLPLLAHYTHLAEALPLYRAAPRRRNERWDSLYGMNWHCTRRCF